MMVESVTTVVIPAPEYFCNLVVFPAPPTINDAAKFVLMKNEAEVPKYHFGSVEAKFLPGSVYCLLPSTERNHGIISVYNTKPSFLDSYTYCQEINPKSVDFLKCEADQPKASSCNEKCSGCFISHFPSPNTSRCKWNKKNSVRKGDRRTLLTRLRGGVNTDPEKLIIKRAVENAKAHGINLHAGVENLGNGNCLFESIIDSINTRSTFQENIEETPDYCRKIWMEEVENTAYDDWNGGLTRAEWAMEWSVLKTPRTYECKLGDLVLPGIAHCIKKDVLVFNTSPNAHSPIYVIKSSDLANRGNNTEVPICLAYDQVHYEPLVPDTDEDVQKTIQLKQAWSQGCYEKNMDDFQFLKPASPHASTSYASAAKRGLAIGSTKPESYSYTKKGEKKSVNNFSVGKLKRNLNVPKCKKVNYVVQSKKLFQEPKDRRGNLNIIEAENDEKAKQTRFYCMSDSDCEELDTLKKIKKKDRSEEQMNRYDTLMKLQRKERVRLNVAKLRSTQTCDKKWMEKEKNKERMTVKRKNQTPDEKNVEKERDKKRKAVKRKNQTPNEKNAEREKLKERMAVKRGNQTPDEKNVEKEKLKERMTAKRRSRTPVENKINIEINKLRMTATRAAQRTSVLYKEGLHTKDILQGSYRVPDLCDTEDRIGDMKVICDHCGALKFKKETSSTCCGNGKVTLECFPEPPKEIDNLWHADTVEGRIFRENARSINNAVCLTSIKVKTKDFGYNPNIIFEGKATQLIGPLQANDGEEPYFAQLYLHDPVLECTQRFKNMTIPASLTSHQKKILEQLLTKIQKVLHTNNPFVKDFKQVIEIPIEELQQGKIVISAKAKPREEHQRRYNEQISLQEVSILKNSEPHDLVLQLRSGSLQDISDLNPKGMPLHFTLLFPYGTYGWDPETKHTDGKRRVTTREFYVYHLNQRDSESDYIFLAGRLFQEWCCMGWIAVENQKLMYQRMNQKALRADTYKNIREITNTMLDELAPRVDGMFKDDDKRPAIGRKILSSSMVGSPRWYNAKFQDGMAIVREFHKPDFFITMTCNPKWPEITSELRKGQTAQDRPDIVARVFKQKKDQLMQDLKTGHIFGKVVAHMNVIEFQKRGLPHVHILIILATEERNMTPEFVDSVVSAELPPDPEETNDSDEREQRRRLQDIIFSNMIHGPCGSANPRCPCMEDGKCTKNFPKEFQKQTAVDPDNNYASYRRRSPEDGGRQFVCPKTNQVIDNRWVVPYNAFLSLRYGCHINVEFCTSPKAAKYLYKYVTKGHDRAMVATIVETQDGQCRDEIQEYEDLRSIGSSEATWHLMAFPIADRYPPVQALRVHLEDQQQVVFDEGNEEEALERQRETELTAFFKLNENLKTNQDPIDNVILPIYTELPKKFRYDKSKKEWVRRKAQSEDTVIGRVHTVNPVAGDVFYLRILLHNDHCRGRTSFTDMKMLPSGKMCESFKEVCREIGLLKDDMEWQQVLEDSTGTKLCPQLRELFVIILMFCQPSNPLALFNEFWDTWIDDFEQQGKNKKVTLDANQLKTILLLDLEMRLQSFEKELLDFGLPQPTQDELKRVQTVASTEHVLIREEMDYDVNKLSGSLQEIIPLFTEEQLVIYNDVLEAVRHENSLLIFIDARGGCGKTFLLNAILAGVRTLEPAGCVALAMATTGIAANLLTLGRTFHSRLKAPLSVNKDSTLQISAQSSLAKLVKMSKLLMIDESTMLDKFQLEALDRSLKDLMDVNQPFGGKIIILAGDFRQCLPVVPNSNRAETVSQCINKSYLWKHFEIYQLSENLRVKASGDSKLEAFDKWTLSVGNGSDLNSRVEIPRQMVTEIVPNTKDNPKSEENAMKMFCQKIFPNLKKNLRIPGWLEGRTVLAPTNREVDSLNSVIQDMLPDKCTLHQSADTLENPADSFRFNTEYLNTLRPNGFPPHILYLKPGMPLMLLRNINPRQGLCNGTRMVFDRIIENKLLQCTVVETKRIVLIPRITFIPKINEYPFEWQRRQYPVRPAFAMTINKSQGQTLKHAGIWLRGDAFSHGQLYVACSRVSSPDNLHFALMRDVSQSQLTAQNVVYKEVLLNNA